jgi:hypothetical protein
MRALVVVTSGAAGVGIGRWRVDFSLARSTH